MIRSNLQPLLRWRPRRPDVPLLLPVQQRRRYASEFDHINIKVESKDDQDGSTPRKAESTMSPREQILWAKLLRSASFDDNLSKIDAADESKAVELAEKLPEGLKEMASTFAQKMRYRKYLEEVRSRSLDDDSLRETDKMIGLRKLRDSEYDRVVQKMSEAKTDYALWLVLQDEVFAKIRSIDAPSTQSTSSIKKKNRLKQKKDDAKEGTASSSKKPAKKTASLDVVVSDFSTIEIVGPNYSKLLIAALNEFSSAFPTSRFPFAILPEIKALGPQSYALAANADLYNKLLQMMWEVHGQYQPVTELLEEMERVGIDFNWVTLEIIRLIAIAGMKAGGSSHDIVRTVYHMQYFTDGLERIKTWRDFIRNRLETAVVREVNEQITGGPNSHMLFA